MKLCLSIRNRVDVKTNTHLGPLGQLDDGDILLFRLLLFLFVFLVFFIVVVLLFVDIRLEVLIL